MEKNKENYLEFKVPVRQNAEWITNLREEMESENVPVRWKNGWYHITVAFMKDDQHVEALKKAFGKILFKTEAFQLTLNKVGVFKARIRNELIINLTSSAPSERFMSLVGSLRSEVEKIGVNLESDFLLHITLGWIDANMASLEEVEKVVNKIVVPPFTLTIKDAEYRYQKGDSKRSNSRKDDSIQKYPLKRLVV